MKFIYATDLHGNEHRYRQLLDCAQEQHAAAVVLGGDMLPLPKSLTELPRQQRFFITGVLRPMLERFKHRSAAELYLLPGNDDAASCTGDLQDLERDGLARYLHLRTHAFGGLRIFGYSFVPLTPFGIKDWDKFDTPGQIPPVTHCPPFFTEQDGIRLIDVETEVRARGTIEDDFKSILSETDPSRTVYVTHSPPFNTALDVLYSGEHIGSTAIRSFIEQARPALTLHGHIHESPYKSGTVFDVIGPTIAVNPGTCRGRLNAVLMDTEDIAGSMRTLEC